MRPRRPLPSIKRMLAEYAAMVLVYIAVFLVGQRVLDPSSSLPMILAVIAMLLTLGVARATRPRQDLPPGDGGPPPGV